MNLHTILPLNGALLWKDWRNSMAMIFTYLGFITVTHPVALLQALNRANRNPDAGIHIYISHLIDRLQFMGDFYFNVTMVMAVVLLGSILVGEERRRNTYSLLLAMPFSRRQVMLSKYVLGVASIFGVYLINGLFLAAIVASSAELGGIVSFQAIFRWMLLQVVVMVAILSFTFVFASLTGTTAASAVLTAIFLVFPAGFVEMVAINLSHRIGYEAYSVLAPVREFSLVISLFQYSSDMNMALEAWPWLVAASVLMLLLTLRVFEANPMEKNGEVLVIEAVKPLFRIGVPLCFTLFFGGFGHNALEIATAYVVGAIVGGLITHYTIGLRRAMP
ncbi:MAG: ABC transporter permease [Bacillota bacterium]